MIKSSILLAITALLFTGCFSDRGPDVWTAWVYPDKTNTKRSMQLGPFPNVEECRKASLDKLAELDLTARGDYKCGLRCGYNEGLKTLICEKTTK